MSTYTPAMIGLGVFPYPSASSNTVSVRTRIREAMAWGLKNLIKKSNGYFLDISEVNVNKKSISGNRVFPSIDIDWLREDYNTNIDGGGSLGGWNKVANISLYCYLKEKKCQTAGEEVVLLREKMIADLEQYFGRYFSIPDSTGYNTAFNSVITDNYIFGMEENEPFAGVQVDIELHYRILQTDPTQTF